MEIFTNWMFWVVLAGMVFIFAIIGFLVENKKNGKEAQPPVNPTDNKEDALNQNITKAPEGNSINLDEVKPASEDTSNTMPQVNVQTMPQVNVQTMPQQEDEKTKEEPKVETQVEQPLEPQENQQTEESISEPQPIEQEPENKTENTTVESTKPNDLPDIAEEVTEEAATLFDNEDDSDVWKV